MGVSAGEVLAWQADFEAGRFVAAVERARRLVSSCPRDARAWQLLGLALGFAGEADEAEGCLEAACRLDRNDAALWDALGVVRMRAGHHAEAARAFRRSLQLAAGVAAVWVNASQNALAGGEPCDALRFAERATGLAPGLPLAQFARGNALHAVGRSEEALAALAAALDLQPGLAIAHQSRGNVLGALGRHREAAECQRQALQFDPTLQPARINLSALLCVLGDTAGAIREARLVLDHDPTAFAAWSNLLYALVHDEASSASVIDATHRDFGRMAEACFGLPEGGWRVSREPGWRLRVGFVSADLRDHPVARFLLPVWRHLDREGFAILAFSGTAADDAVAVELRGLSDEWHEVSRLSDAALEALIRERRVDILFDLSGHTAGNRLAVFARKPAPLQVTWLGYPGTTGLSSVDIRLVDATLAPPGRFDAAFAERLCHLPQATAFEPPAGLSPVAPAPCMARGHLTFGSFNRAGKLTAATLALWGQVLRCLPDARLLIAAVTDDGVADGIRQRLAAEGVLPERLSFVGRLSLPDYLALHGEVDIALDTQPFSSGTTANFALWMGVPTLTLSGERFVQRLCASRLAAAGLPGFVAWSDEEFVARACHWAAHPAELAALRDSLRERMTVQAERQPAELTRALEGVLREAWAAFCAAPSEEVE